MRTFTVATYNVNSLRSRLHIVMPWLETHRPTVLCIQETKVEDRFFPIDAFTAVGYHVIFRGEKRYNGVALASIIRPIEVSFGLRDGGPADEDRLIRAVFPETSVVTTYVPQGTARESPHFQYKLQWFKRLRGFFEDYYHPRDPVIWCGDMNVAPEQIDVHDPKRLLGHVCFTPEVWDAFEGVTSWGFHDLFRKHHPGETGHYTFFDYRVPRAVERGLGWRVDHILGSDGIVEKSKTCEIDLAPRTLEKPSDHTVVIGEFEL